MAVPCAACLGCTPQCTVEILQPTATFLTFCPLCSLQDKSIPATVKIQVLSTAYNSTTSEAILFDSYYTFSHPTAGLSPSQVRVFSTQTDPNTGAPMNTEGSITSVQQVREAPASSAASQKFLCARAAGDTKVAATQLVILLELLHEHQLQRGCARDTHSGL